MYALRETKKCEPEWTPHVLPCRIKHDGPVDACHRHWAPVREKNNHLTSYFRGRRLKGEVCKVPQGHTGVVIVKKANITNETTDTMVHLDHSLIPDSDLEEQQVEDVGIYDEAGTFKEIVVWGHDGILDTIENPYSKGLDEWIQLSDKIHQGFDVQPIEDYAKKH